MYLHATLAVFRHFGRGSVSSGLISSMSVLLLHGADGGNLCHQRALLGSGEFSLKCFHIQLNCIKPSGKWAKPRTTAKIIENTAWKDLKKMPKKCHTRGESALGIENCTAFSCFFLRRCGFHSWIPMRYDLIALNIYQHAIRTPSRPIMSIHRTPQ